MALTKVNYVDNVTVIGATNLNAIQDEIIANGTAVVNLSNGKVDKVVGKGLSTNDFSDEAALKLSNIEAGATHVEVDDELSTSSENAIQNKVVTEELNKKISTGGTYEDLTAGNAMQIVSDAVDVDQVPYAFRKTGGNLTVGKREMDKLVGGTVVWNQFVNNGVIHVVTSSAQDWENFTSGSFNFSIISGHKYLFTLVGKTVSGGGIGLRDVQNSIVYRPNPLSYSIIYSAGISTNGSTSIQGKWDSGDTDAYLNAFDLTKMFGSTIADYIYSLETATAGAGVAFFRSLFPNSYYAYNSGTLMSVNAASHKTVGKNQCIKTVRGYCGAGAVAVSVDGDAESVVFYAKEGEQYTVSSVAGLNRSCLAPIGTTNVINGTPTLAPAVNLGNTVTTWTATWTGFTIWYVKSTRDEVMEQTVQVEIGSTATAYEPYVLHEYPLDSTLTLRGIPKLDSNNKLYYDGDEYASDGTVTRKYGAVDMGTLDWSTTTEARMTSTGIQSLVKANADGTSNIRCSIYYADTNDNVYNHVRDKSIAIHPNGRIMVYDSSYSDAAAFKTAMSGVYFVYELATPTTESAEPFQNPQICDPNGTEEYVDAGVTASTPTRDVAIPVGHETEYPVDLVAKIEGLPSDFSTLIAPTEKTTTASKGYSVNELLIMNNQLYKVTSPISSGGTITVGTNVTATTIGAILTQLLNA